MLRKSRLLLLGALLNVSVWAALPVHAADPPKNPCAAQNPCAPGNPCAANNPCAPQNPCAAKNACARTVKNPGGDNQLTPPAGGEARAASRKPAITHPTPLSTPKRDASVKDAVARGRKVFRGIGCVSCHPRGRTIRGTVVDVKGARHPVPVPTLIGAADHFPRLSPAGQVASVGQFNDWCATTFIGNPPMNPYSQEYKDLEAYVVSLTPARYERMLEWEAKRKAFMKTAQPAAGGANPGGGDPGEPKNPGRDSPVARNLSEPANPCAPNNPGAPANPCAATNPRAPQSPGASSNPCAAQNPCAPQNPCAAKNPCANNPCAPKNPCAARNPCAKNPCAKK